MACQENCVPCIDLEIAIGFEGSIPRGLKCHPGGYHLVYAVGNAVVIEHLETKEQTFLQDICSEECNYHRMKITCLDLSVRGKYVAAGTENRSCSNASVVVWCFETRCMLFRYAVHRIRVEALAFTCDEAYLFSLGGPDDRCVTITDVEKKKPLCSATAQKNTSGNAQCIATANTSNSVFVTANTLRIWDVDMETHRLRPTEILLGKTIRHITCLAICMADEMGYAGTTTGDVVTFNLQKRAFSGMVATRSPFQLGITQVAVNRGTKELLVGSGTGLVSVLNICMCRTNREKCLEGRITSIVSRGCSTFQFFVGTDIGNIYQLDLITNCIKKTLLKTSHYDSVNDLAFPCGESDLLVSGSRQEVRIWNLRNHWELLRIVVHNRECLTVCLSKDGRTILTGWDDCRIRAYYPESGASMYIVESAYGTKVTALTTSEDSCRIISGSDLGHVVIWKVPNYLEDKCHLYVFDHVLLKEHRAPVTDIKVRTVQKIFEDPDCPEDVDEIMSCSMDGTLIVWNVRKRLASISIKTHYTMFKAVVFDPCCHTQAIATGTGGRLTYWELCRGVQLYQCDDCGSRCDINSLDIDCSAEYMVTGDDDRTFKVWRHGDGKVIFRGYSHSCPINKVKISPNRCRIASASNDGAIFIWRFTLVPESSLPVPCEPAPMETCQPVEAEPCEPAEKGCEKGQGDC